MQPRTPRFGALRGLLLTIATLSALLPLPPRPAAAGEGLFLVADAPFFQESWERTAGGRWHYSAGPVFGLRAEAELPFLSLWAESGLFASSMASGQSSGLGWGFTGQRTSVGARVERDGLAFEATYELKSWFVDSPAYGPEYLVDRGDLVQALRFRVIARVL